MQIPPPLKGLLLSRKFWLASIGAIVAAVLYIQESITADALVDAILVLVITVAAGITIEDAAEKNAQGKQPAPGSGQMMVGGDATIINEADAEPADAPMIGTGGG